MGTHLDEDQYHLRNHLPRVGLCMVYRQGKAAISSKGEVPLLPVQVVQGDLEFKIFMRIFQMSPLQVSRFQSLPIRVLILLEKAMN